MAMHDQLRRAAWRKSTYSNGATQCVEAASIGRRTAIRDSRNPDGVVLLLPDHSMRALARHIKAGQVPR